MKNNNLCVVKLDQRKKFYFTKIAQAMDYKFVEVSSIVKSILETDKRSEMVNKPELDIAITNHLKTLAEQDNLLISEFDNQL